MSTDHAIFMTAALGLPTQVRAELAARLLASLEEAGPPPDDRSPEQWAKIIEARSDALHAGQAAFVDAEALLKRVHEQISKGTAAS